MRRGAGLVSVVIVVVLEKGLGDGIHVVALRKGIFIEDDTDNVAGLQLLGYRTRYYSDDVKQPDFASVTSSKIC